jgi:hypothetical protein
MTENLDTRDAPIGEGTIVQIYGLKGQVFRMKVTEVLTADSFNGDVIEIIGEHSPDEIGDNWGFNRVDVRWVEKSA